MNIVTVNRTTIAVAIATLSLGLLAATGASADNGVQQVNKKVTHALDKAGHATAYSAHKDYKQTTVVTHKALGKNSVVRNNKTKKNYIVHPGGTKTPEPRSSTADR